MPDAKVVFLHGLPDEVVDVITPCTTDGFVTEPMRRDQPIEV